MGGNALIVEREWVYSYVHAMWRDQITGEYGFPVKGDWYLEWDEWRRWQ